MQAIKRMGILYGRLGLSADPDLIAKRATGVAAAADALDSTHYPYIVGRIFELNIEDDEQNFLEYFSESDPTFDVRTEDKEASLLACSIVAYEMENNPTYSGLLALCLVTASFGGIRSPIDEQLIELAHEILAENQSVARRVPPDREYMKKPDDITLQTLADYAERNALSAKNNDNIILEYIRKLEEEVSTLWWVTGGWSTDIREPFSKLTPLEASLRAGKELAEKSSSELGLFAAPALLSMVIESGRKATAIRAASLVEAATSSDYAWRSEIFQPISEGPFAELLPLSMAQGIAASCRDEADWQPRFKRLTGIDPLTKMKPQDLALQLYREQIMLRSLED